jgi:hypothetical protein
MTDVAQISPISRVLVGVDLNEASAAAPEMAGSLAAAWAEERHAPLSAIGRVLKKCVRPVLFVPSSQGVVERSPS